MNFSAETLFLLIFFLRIALVVTFGLSFFAKIRRTSKFKQSIVDFRILPSRLCRISAPLFMVGELMVALCLSFGGQLLLPGFLVATILMSIFSVALVSAMKRRLRVTCNCFGASESQVSIYDIWRNVGLILCALLGWGTLMAMDDRYQVLSLIESSFVALTAIVFTLIWIHLSDIAHLFTPT